MNANVPIAVLQRIEERSQYRTHILGLFFLIITLVFLARIIYIQTWKHDYFSDLANSQYVHIAAESFDRGSIYFSRRKGELVPAAQLRTLYTLALDTNALKNATSAYEILSAEFPIDKDIFFEKAGKVNDPYEKLLDNLPEEKVEKLKSLKIPGVIFSKENYRGYPQDEVGAKVIGFVGFDTKGRKGQYGLERYYDDVLVRASDSKLNFFAELFADIKSNIASNAPGYEGNLVLTIDAEAERFLHQTLIETKKEWNGEIVGGIVMDPKTGAIIAMESLPSFNPNNYGDTTNQSYYMNNLVSGVYEMGSIIKPLTVAAALDADAITATSTYTDTGFRELDGFTVKNYDGRARGVTNIQTILDKSLNVGIVYLVEKMGAPTFQKYFKSLGFGEETGIDLPSEGKGLTKNLDSKVFVDSATSGFGQGIATTPIQTIRALATLGNGGNLVNPHVVKSIIFENGDVKEIVPNEPRKVYSEETSEEITRMLVHVVDTALKDGAYKMPRYSIAAKTGTAQISKPGGGYYEDRYLHSLFGYFPAYDPKFIIFLFHTYPKGAQYASATLSDPFFKMVKFLLAYYEIPPDR